MKKFYEKFIFFFCADLRADDGIPIVLSPHEIYAWHKNTEAFVKQKSGQRPQEVSHLPQFSLYSNNTKRRGQICAISYGIKKRRIAADGCRRIATCSNSVHSSAADLICVIPII